ncbi:MAG: hypothetical protein ACNI27_13225 [Desulfovibrio sp.]
MKLFKILLTGALVLAMASFVFAGAKTGDITVDSEVGSVANIGVGKNVNAETNVHSVNVKDGSKTGDITVTGKAGHVVNVGAGKNVNAQTNVGSVKVGD